MYLLITGKPTGFDEIWVIGDTHILARTRQGLENIKQRGGFTTQHIQNNKLPYLLENYEVILSPCHYSWAFTAQIKGGLAHLLSTKWRLPNHLYIIFSNDQVDDSDVLGDMIYKVLEELFTFVDRAILERKMALPRKAKRGIQTKFTVIKTVAKSQELLNRDNFKNRRRNFNRALQKISSNFNWRSVNIDAIIPTKKAFFDEQGNDLLEEGAEAFWEFISQDLMDRENPLTYKQESKGSNRASHHN